METYKKIKSEVVVGNQLGRTVGMPTANFNPDNIESSYVPKDGVYLSKVWLPNNDEKIGLTNIGAKPSIDDSGKINIETHILDFDGDLYGKEIEILPLEYIRNIKKFDSLDDVKKQVDLDIKIAKSLYAGI